MLQLSLLLALPFASAILYPKATPDKAPAGYSQWTSPIVLPAPQTEGTGDWASAVKKARQFVSKLTLEEKM
jgi:beta-glucosidase